MIKKNTLKRINIIIVLDQDLDRDQNQNDYCIL